MSTLFIDFETRSTLDLKVVGLDNYARHPTTDVWCLAYCFDSAPVEIVGGTAPSVERVTASRILISAHIAAGGAVVAHNAAFELAVWNEIMAPRYGWPKLKPEQCVCTLAMAHAMGLPGALADAAPAAGVDAHKDMAGHRLMLQMRAPRSLELVEGAALARLLETHPTATPTGRREHGAEWYAVWWDEPAKLALLAAYCKQDVEVERELYKRLKPLSPSERAVWLLDYRINQRGVPVDLPKIKAAITVVQAETERLNSRIQKLTNNYVSRTTEVARTAEWVRAQGVDIPGLAKADLLTALADVELPDAVRAVLETRQEAARSSTAKLAKMLDLAGPDGRVRNTKQYHGAGTGRWAGRGMQTDNFPRPTLKQKEIERAIELLPDTAALELLYAPPSDGARRVPGAVYEHPMGVISGCLRGMIVARPRCAFLVGDYANIEGRVLAWLAGEEWKLNAFRHYDAGTGPDLYKLMANRIYDVPIEAVTKEQRQIGKVAELACGYQGGVGAFQTMAKTYYVKVADEMADEIKTKWRAAHPAIVKFWYALEDAAKAAVLDGTRVHKVGPVIFHKSGSFLRCKLPSGRLMWYPYPKLIEVETPWGDLKEAVTYMTVVDQSAAKKEKIIEDPFSAGRWQRVSTYGGKLAENITQAVARDLLAAALLRLDGYRFKWEARDAA